MNERAYKGLWLIWWSLLTSSVLIGVISVFFSKPMQSFLFLIGSILMMAWLLFGFVYQNRMVDEWVSRSCADPEERAATADVNASGDRSARE